MTPDPLVQNAEAMARVRAMFTGGGIELPESSPHTPPVEQVLSEIRDLRRDFTETLKGLEPAIGGLAKDVSALRTDVSSLRTDFTALKVDVAEAKGRLSQMPSTMQIVGIVLAIMGATFALIRFGLPH